MGGITLRVLDGADRGRVFTDLAAPVTIGREEGNTIQLNDERVSRFHLKIQEDHEKLVLTDLESTNGTKVNGEDIQLRILRVGDMVTIGRSVLLFGSREEIAGRVAQSKRGHQRGSSGGGRRSDSYDFDLDAEGSPSGDAVGAFAPPELPDRLSPGQAAQLFEVLDYIHHHVRGVVGSVKPDGRSDGMVVDAREWQGLLELQSRLAEYLRAVSDPDRAG